MNERNPHNIGNGEYIVYYSNPLNKEVIKKFKGVCENFNTNEASAFWNSDDEQMLLVRYRDIVALYPIG
jgi:hypothetical protein